MERSYSILIKKIVEIGSFGVFNKFFWDADIPLFGKHNIIYGWNYSGKTTISRIFQAFELSKLPVNCQGICFEIEDDKGMTFTQADVLNHSNLQIRVYNSEFVQTNLGMCFLEGDSAPPIFILGEENIEKQALLIENHIKYSKIKIKQDELITKKLVKAEGVRDELTKMARNIKNDYSIPDYNREKLKNVVQTILLNSESFLLDEIELEKSISVYRSVDDKDELSKVIQEELQLSKFQTLVKEVIAREISVKSVISELKDNAKLNVWVKDGLPLHANHEICYFCNNELQPERIKQIQDHFSEEYEQLDRDLKSIVAGIKDHAKVIQELKTPDKSALYFELALSYEESKQQYCKEQSKYLSSLRELQKLLESRILSPFTVNSPPSTAINSQDLTKALNRINSTILRHNERYNNLSRDKATAREKLLKHNAAQFIEDNNYKGYLDELRKIDIASAANTGSLEGISQEIKELEKELSEAVRGEKRINYNLKCLFNSSVIQVELTTNNQLRIIRAGEPAHNLSEGEKSLIALAYFVARIESKDTNLDETIVFVDDPVSSLDSNHIVSIHTFLTSRIGDCMQVFFSTHNLEYFNLLKQWIAVEKNTAGKEYKKNYPGFFIHREYNGSNYYSMIKDLPPELRNYRSEYAYLYSVLTNYVNSDSSTGFNLHYLIPNVLRRFLEAYLGARYPDSKSWHKKLNKLIPVESSRLLVDRFVNDYSHNRSINSALQLPDTSECKKVVNIVLTQLEGVDPTHVAALNDGCNLSK